jgi:hypothetical protein
VCVCVCVCVLRFFVLRPIFSVYECYLVTSHTVNLSHFSISIYETTFHERFVSLCTHPSSILVMYAFIYLPSSLYVQRKRKEKKRIFPDSSPDHNTRLKFEAQKLMVYGKDREGERHVQVLCHKPRKCYRYRTKNKMDGHEMVKRPGPP